MLIYKKKQKKMKNMINKCYSSTINLQNKLKTCVITAFKIKIKCVDNIDLFKQKKSIKWNYLFSNTKIIKNTA